MTVSDSPFVGWTAIAGGVVGVVGFIALLLLFVVGEPFGTLNDILSIPVALLVAPLLLALYRLHAASYPAVAVVALLAGLAGYAAAAIGSGLLVLGRIDFNTSLLFGIGGFGLIGLWALLTSGMGLRGDTLPGAAAWAGLALSVAPTLALLAVLRAESVANALNAMGGQTGGTPPGALAMVFFILGGLSYAAMPLWIVWLGRLFLAGRVGLPAAVALGQ